MAIPTESITLVAPEWERQISETPAAFRAFRAYLHFKGNESLLKCYQYFLSTEKRRKTQKNAKSAPNAWFSYRKIFRWDERVVAYIADEDKRREERKREREKILEDEQWEDRQALREVAQKMLKISLDESQWTLNTAVKMVALANALGREAVGKDQEKAEEKGENVSYTYYIPNNGRQTDIN